MFGAALRVAVGAGAGSSVGVCFGVRFSFDQALFRRHSRAAKITAGAGDESESFVSAWRVKLAALSVYKLMGQAQRVSVPCCCCRSS